MVPLADREPAWTAPRASPLVTQIGRETLADLEQARVRMMVRGRSVWEEALAAFARDHDRKKLLRAFLDAPPLP
jgi:hypothetical protein